MKILLVYPEIPQTFWNLKHALKFISRKALLPPLGLLTVAAMLPENWQKKLVDMTVKPLTDRDIEWADMVFISGMFIQKDSACKVIERCKKLRTKVVGGGPAFTSGFDYFEDVDYLVLGEAEVTLPLFLEDLKNGHPKSIYRCDVHPNLSQTPAPLWDLIDMKKYAIMGVQYSRGCPFSCEFCDVTKLFGRRIRTKNTEQMLQELDNIYLRRWRDKVFIVDDNFIANKTKLKSEVLLAMIEWMEKRKYPFVFNTQVSINIADDEELMRLMVRAGFEAVFVGIETPDEQTLAECSKFQNRNRDLIACVKKIQQFGLQVQGGFILGFDSDRISTFDTLIKFIQKSGIVTAMVGLLNAPRGTKLYDRLLSEDRLLKDSTGDNTDFSINFIPKMDRQDLINGYRDVIKTIYSPKYYYQRVLTLLRNFEPLKKKRGFRFSGRDAKALIKTMWFLGIIEKGRTYYWRLIFWSLFKRPQAFQLAVTFAIYGFHFRRIFEAY